MNRKTLVLAAGVVGMLAVAVGLSRWWLRDPPPPPPPRRPPEPAAASTEMKYSATLYRALVEQDAKKLGVSPPTTADWAAPFPYFDELGGRRSLRVGRRGPGGDNLSTEHLKLTLAVKRAEGAVEGQSFRADHLILAIENRSDHHLAYRVTTDVPDAARCEAKGVIEHDAVALRPRETVRRTECLLQKAAAVAVTRVEVVEIPALSYYYLSRLAPGLMLYDTRTAAGHTPPRGTICPQTFSWRDIRDGADRGEIAWRDIIDFYARHNCDEYAFFPGYRYRVDASLPLPARAALREAP